MKYDNDVRNIQKEAIVAVSKATELFLSYISTCAFQVASRKKRKTVKDSDLIEVINSQELLKFLQADFPKQSTTTVSNHSRKEVQNNNDNNNNNENDINDNNNNQNDIVRKYFKPKITEFTEN